MYIDEENIKFKFKKANVKNTSGTKASEIGIPV